MSIHVAHALESCGQRGGEDRIAIVRGTGRLAIVVADGAGGTGAGAAAAETLVDFVTAELESDASVELVGLLARAGEAVGKRTAGGETTAVVVVADDRGLRGASAGDSAAWLIGRNVHVLTAGQIRKPLLGARGAVAVPFDLASTSGTLVVGTDGLFKYASQAKITATVRHERLADVPGKLIDLVRLRSGGLQDDVAVVVARWDQVHFAHASGA